MSTDTPDRGGAPRPASTLENGRQNGLENGPENGIGRSATTEGEPAVSMPPSDTRLLVAAGVCLLVPVVALLWVSSYARETPRLGGIPFFFWYQFAWVFLTSVLTWTAYRLVLAARRPRDDVGDRVGDREGGRP